MATPLLPQAFWFHLAVACPRVDAVPSTAPKGRLLDLPDSCKLPETTLLDGRPGWAEVRVGWNPKGLAISVDAAGGSLLSFEDRPEGAYGFHVWVDTRDTRNVARATRFCHRFAVRLRPGTTKSAPGVEVVQRPIARATADAPMGPADRLIARAERLRQGWRADLFLPAEALHGFDPETNRRLGLAYQVTDPEREDQFLGVGREFPVGENPSLWATLELKDGR